VTGWTKFVNVLAVLVALGVLAAEVWIVVIPSWSDPVPAPVQSITHTDKTTPGTPGTETTVVTTTEAQSLTERYLRMNHLGNFVLIGIALLLALLAGGIVQRMLRGEFAVTVGPVQLSPIALAASLTGEAVGLVAKQVETTRSVVRKTVEELATATNRTVVEPKVLTELKALDDDTTLKQVDEKLGQAREALRDAGY
jgi:hypothetical protein